MGHPSGAFRFSLKTAVSLTLLSALPTGAFAQTLPPGAGLCLFPVLGQERAWGTSAVIFQDATQTKLVAGAPVANQTVSGAIGDHQLITTPQNPPIDPCRPRNQTINGQFAGENFGTEMVTFSSGSSKRIAVASGFTATTTPVTQSIRTFDGNLQLAGVINESGNQNEVLGNSMVEGDVTGDGVPELVVAQLGKRVLVYNAQSLSRIGEFSSAQAGYSVPGEFARSVAIVSDVNGDGRRDIVIGNSNDPGQSNASCISVLSVQGSAPNFNFVGLPQKTCIPAFVVGFGTRVSKQFGYSVAHLGNIETSTPGTEIAVGAPNTPQGPGLSGAGEVHFLSFVGSSGATQPVSLLNIVGGTPQSSIRGGQPAGKLGYSVSASEVSVGAETRLVLGEPGFGVGGIAPNMGLSSLFHIFHGPGQPILVRSHNYGGALDEAAMGTKVSLGPDIDSNGTPEILLSAPATTSQTYPGGVSVLSFPHFTGQGTGAVQSVGVGCGTVSGTPPVLTLTDQLSPGQPLRIGRTVDLRLCGIPNVVGLKVYWVYGDPLSGSAGIPIPVAGMNSCLAHLTAGVSGSFDVTQSMGSGPTFCHTWSMQVPNSLSLTYTPSLAFQAIMINRGNPGPYIALSSNAVYFNISP